MTTNMLDAPHMPVETLNTSELAVALYAAHPGDSPDIRTALLDAITDLGGIEQVHQLARTWARLNVKVMYGAITDEEYARQMAAHWPDPARLEQCNGLAFCLKACMRL